MCPSQSLLWSACTGVAAVTGQSPHRSSCAGPPGRSCWCCRWWFSGPRSSCWCSVSRSHYWRPSRPPRLATVCSSHSNRDRGEERTGARWFVSLGMYTKNTTGCSMAQTHHYSGLLVCLWVFIILGQYPFQKPLEVSSNRQSKCAELFISDI